MAAEGAKVVFPLEVADASIVKSGKENLQTVACKYCNGRRHGTGQRGGVD